MKNHKLIITAGLAALLLLAAFGSAAGVEKAEPVKSETAVSTPVKQSPQPALAEGRSGEQIKWQVISSGGAKGSSASFQLSGTVGQTAVGYGSSTNYGLSHGFWQQFGPTTCCNHDGIRGDVDMSGSINVSDVTYLVYYLFRHGPEPPCSEEGDVDGNSAINVADVTYIVYYLFRSGPAPSVCP